MSRSMWSTVHSEQIGWINSKLKLHFSCSLDFNIYSYWLSANNKMLVKMVSTVNI